MQALYLTHIWDDRGEGGGKLGFPNVEGGMEV